MTERDWLLLTDWRLGDPLADIEPWMEPPQKCKGEKVTSLDIELAVANWLGILPSHGGMGSNRNILVPNFKGMYLHECDLLLVSGAGWVTEIEIKVSVSDLRADKKKWHEHYSPLIRHLFFAMPSTMESNISDVPMHAGVLLIENGKCCEIRRPTANKSARKLTDKEILHIGRIAAMRIWTLKRKLNNIQGENNEQRND